MKTSTANKLEGKFVLENVNGQVVRTLDWEGLKLSVIYRHDTRRIETIDDLKSLEKQNIEFTVIKEVRKTEVQKKAVEIGNIGTLRYLEEIESLTPSIDSLEDDARPFIASMKWIGGVGSSLLVLLMIIGYFVKPEEQEVRIVQIQERPEEIKQEVQRPEPVKPQRMKKQVVAVSKKQKVNPRLARTATVRRATKVVTNQMSLNQMGALGVLGNAKNSNHKGGLNLNAVNTSKGIGRGGNQGSGGMQTSLYGKGLTSAPLGEGQRANGAGGYGTHGAGGGQAGYGKTSLVGSAGSFFQPVRSESLVEGGLDRNEIDAVINRHAGELRYCYEQGLQQSPKLSGRVSMKFFIGSDGYVTTARVSNSSLHNSQVEGCITNRLKSWKFPNPRGGVVVKVSYPFVFRRTTDT